MKVVEQLRVVRMVVKVRTVVFGSGHRRCSMDMKALRRQTCSLAIPQISLIQNTKLS